ncbi:MAG: ribosomal subunit interface protein [Hyphomicrobiales bacterium]|nr:MAG: ribosomal subunit interface protein [Hyphomicrobiales bacterium]
MQVQITGKNFDIGDSLRSHIADRVEQVATRYFGDRIHGHVSLAKEGNDFRTECFMHVASGIDIHAHGQAVDAYSSFDEAAEKLDKRLRRYKRRLTDHSKRRTEPVPGYGAASYVIAAGQENEEEPEELTPIIIAETTTTVRTLSVGEAVMQLDLGEAPMLVFHNSSHGRTNVVYYRADGNIGWIDPEPSKS